ncbi:DUF222 domain-containing protein [Amycolatopsis speibonae]|uniref:DUF222 domain-containing protein n=1 Tax=Amycolatopsis speibonae TaxID=1450224 RepID=A0ABV7P5S2_9PSEU
MSETVLPELPQELWRAGKLELAHGVRQFLQVMRVASAGLGQYLAEVESRGVKDLFGYGSTVSWFADVAGLSWGEARPTVNQAIALNPTRALDGTEVPALAPATGALAAEGMIGAERIAQILEILGRIPPDTSVEDRESAEKILADLARGAGPRQVADAEQRIMGWLDPDGNEPKDPEPKQPRREVTLERRKDGFWKLNGLLDDETGARTAAALEAYAKPRPVDEFGQVDPRSKAERQGDAWAELLDLAIACPDQPGTSGYRTLVHVTIGLDELKSGIGKACLDFVGTMTAREARMAACDCLMLPVVLNAAGEPLDVGRLRRFVTPGQRRALNIRDRGCAFPGVRHEARLTSVEVRDLHHCYVAA